MACSLSLSSLFSAKTFSSSPNPPCHCTNPFLSLTPPHSPTSPRSHGMSPPPPPYPAPKQFTPSRTTTPNAPPLEWPVPLPSSGSHAPPSGSHGGGPGGEESEPRSPDPGSVPTLTPVTYRRNRGGQTTTATWRPLPQGMVKDLMKALQEYGHDSLFFQGLLSSSLAGLVVVPQDLRQLFRCFSSKTEFKLWEATWKDLLRHTLPSLLKDPATSTDNGGDPITMDHLVGEGDWEGASWIGSNQYLVFSTNSTKVTGGLNALCSSEEQKDLFNAVGTVLTQFIFPYFPSKVTLKKTDQKYLAQPLHPVAQAHTN
ncbi:hypothetical protein HGM15179_016202 [Zosterops borbonicus]|uniref:Uncharacterized protein n=1 Tax=Zosterops borbonicus TaxID=364589 RepID=A0A8K1G3K8_9PASS|nr:hypothetical protein HGM15179_016202 [Zosterops borbonicus]